VELVACVTGASPTETEIRVRLRNTDNQPFRFVGQVNSSNAPQGQGPDSLTDQGGGILDAGQASAFPVTRTPTGLGPLVATWDFHFWLTVWTRTRGAHVSVSGINDESKCRVIGTAEITR
jgi:hypothetical protein